jgi:8-oxo-dGTP pyrophosphatase MutT (NUDIX family)
MWTITDTAERYSNKWMRVVEDQVLRPDGMPGIYGVVEVRCPSVFVVALTDAEEVVLVTIDRHTVGRSIEVPAGGTDGEPALVAAQRELLEETGLTGSTWREVGRMFALNGICRAPEYVFLATGLTRGTASGQHEEGIIEARTWPWGRVMDMIARGEITDGETIAALMFAAIALGRLS